MWRLDNWSYLISGRNQLTGKLLSFAVFRYGGPFMGRVTALTRTQNSLHTTLPCECFQGDNTVTYWSWHIKSNQVGVYWSKPFISLRHEQLISTDQSMCNNTVRGLGVSLPKCWWWLERRTQDLSRTGIILFWEKHCFTKGKFYSVSEIDRLVLVLDFKNDTGVYSYRSFAY